MATDATEGVDRYGDGPDLTQIAARVKAMGDDLDAPGVMQCERDRAVLYQEILRLQKMVKWMSEKVIAQSELLARKRDKITDALEAGG